MRCVLLIGVRSPVTGSKVCISSPRLELATRGSVAPALAVPRSSRWKPKGTPIGAPSQVAEGGFEAQTSGSKGALARG